MRLRIIRLALPIACVLLVAAVSGCGAFASTGRAASGTPIAATPTAPSTTAPGDPTRAAWTLTDLVVDGIAVPPAGPPWHAPTLQFRPQDGQVVGEAGCNSYIAAYTLHGDALHLVPVGQTLVACPGAAMDEEHAYLAALPRVGRFAAVGDTLTLSSDDGGVRLTFHAA